MQRRNDALKITAAFAAIYLLWGGTYLAIALGLQSIPAFILIAARSLLGGAVLLVIAYCRTSQPRPFGDWGHAAVGGAFLFIGCHGALAYAQRQVPSGLAAVLLATIPFWIVLVNTAITRSEPPSKLLGLIPGFAGVALITWHDTSSSAQPLSWTMILLLLASSLSWALGTVYSQRRAVHIPSDHLAAMQLICGGAGLLLVSVFAGEWRDFAIGNVTLTSAAGMLYLALLGSVVGNTAYLWLLERMAAPIVATYTFVNPVIALLLGWWVLGERITWISFLATALVISSIILLLAVAERRELESETSSRSVPGCAPRRAASRSNVGIFSSEVGFQSGPQDRMELCCCLSLNLGLLESGTFHIHGMARTEAYSAGRAPLCQRSWHMNVQDRATAEIGGIVSLSPLIWQNPSPQFLDQLPVAIYACDAHGRILWFNSRAAQLWGRTPRIGDDSDLFCGSYKLYLDGRLSSQKQTPMAEVLRTGVPIHGVEARIERPDGSHICVVAHIAPIFDEDGVTLGAINCFHERATGGRPETSDARPEDWMRLRDQRLAASYEHVGAGIVEVDQDGRMLRVNQQLCNLTGYSASELLGRTIFNETLPEDVSADRERFRAQLAGEIDRYTIEKRIYRRDGGHFWASVTSSSIRDAAGKFLYAVRVQHDVSDRKHAEQALARRMEEQAALFAFSERLQHCTSAQEVYQAALDAITNALACERASILLFDSADVMRFVAWRGLSETYRRAVEGHSPWPRDEIDPRPVCVEDVAAAGLPDDLKAAIVSEGIASAAFIPILDDGRLTGKFMAYHRCPHRFTETELEVGLTLARLLGFCLARLAGEAARKIAERDAQQLAAIVESSDDAVVSKDLAGIVQTWNDGAERLFGYTRDEIVGQSITILIPDDHQDEEPEILAKIRAGERVHHFETVRRRKDGRLIDISLTISPIRDRAGRIIGASKIARDITAKKLAETRLRDSERRLQELLDAIPAAIYTTDAEGKITYFNEFAVEFAGRTPTLGSDEWCVTWKLYNPDGTPLPHDQCPMAVALKEGRPVRGAEAVAERPDGTRIPFVPFPTPLRDASGKVVGAINMLVDLSERKQAETQQRLLLNELNHRTKNNMQVLQSVLFSAARNARSEEARHVLQDASGRIAAMAAAQRVLYGTIDATRFSAEEFLGAVVETVQQTLPPHVTIVRAPASGVLSNDMAMPLALILNELLTNAAKHGVKNPGRDTIRVGLSEREGQFELHVEDDGPGFDLAAVRDSSSGLRLVLGLARPLRAEFSLTKNPTRASLRFASGGRA